MIKPSHFTPKNAPSPRILAKETLRRPGVRMGTILATIVVFTFWVGTIYLVENTWYALDWNALYDRSPFLYDLMDFLLYVVDGIVILFCGIPLLYGWIRYMTLSATGAMPPYSTLFAAFKNGKCYARALGLMLLYLLRYALLLGGFALLLALSFWTNTLGGIAGITMMLLFAIAAGTVLILGVILLCHDDAVFLLDITHPEYSVPRLFAKSHDLLQGQATTVWVFKLTMIPWWIVGFISFGTLLLFHALPYTCFAHQRLLWQITGIIPAFPTETNTPDL